MCQQQFCDLVTPLAMGVIAAPVSLLAYCIEVVPRGPNKESGPPWDSSCTHVMKKGSLPQMYNLNLFTFIFSIALY